MTSRFPKTPFTSSTLRPRNAFLSVLLLCAATLGAQPIALVEDWIAAPSDGVTLHISRDGDAMRLDYDFRGGSGYAIARKPVVLDLPDDYEFTFRIRGDTPPNTLEFKLVDETGENVWWVNNRNYRFPAEWTPLRIKKRHLEFAWGPGGATRPLTRVSAIEIVVTASTGSKGTVWIDALRFERREPAAPLRESSVTTSGDTITVDLGGRREFGGLTIEWGERFPSGYVVELSDDGTVWRKVYEVARSTGGRDPIFLPDADARFARIRTAAPFELRNVRVEPLSFSTNRNVFFSSLAVKQRPGMFPKYFGNVQSYWTVAGIPGSEREILINEEGAIEIGMVGPTIEPFLWTSSKLVTWRDVETTQSLVDGVLPIPSVTWKAEGLRLVTTAIAVPGDPTLYAQYEVTNTTNSRQIATLFLAIRPFQVNPPWQFLNVQGGVAEVHELALRDGVVHADTHAIVPMTEPDAFGATAFDSGEIHESLARGVLPAENAVTDPFRAASGALRYDLALEAGATKRVMLALPENGVTVQPPGDATRKWSELLSRFSIDLPAVAGPVARIVKSNVAYILINGDGAAIQPGSRSYDRSWIRDGSLTSAALLRLGYTDEARAFVEWFAKSQFPSGKVPCCVDGRGADPVPEHDSSGEFIFAVAEVYRYTNDRAFLGRMGPHVDKAVTWLESLVAERSTPQYRGTAFFGLVPESISHEGYSAKPMHSYWDDFFTLRGFKDAVVIAKALNKDSSRFERLRDEFRRNLLASIDRTMADHRIDYIPGSVELGDFDATSTTIALNPVDEDRNLPRRALEATFERYYREATRRPRDYTPYETRSIGAFVRLGQRERANEMLRFFLRDVRPQAWNHWAEVVWGDPATPKFIGDMPHTWVGSDFIRSVLDMFAYESDDRLIVGAGLPLEWIASEKGVRIRGLRTYWGTLDLHAHGTAKRIVFDFDGKIDRTIVVRPPRGTNAFADGRRVPITNGEIVLERVPKRLVVTD